jgi:hypothetical protein
MPTEREHAVPSGRGGHMDNLCRLYLLNGRMGPAVIHYPFVHPEPSCCWHLLLLGAWLGDHRVVHVTTQVVIGLMMGGGSHPHHGLSSRQQPRQGGPLTGPKVSRQMPLQLAPSPKPAVPPQTAADQGGLAETAQQGAIPSAIVVKLQDTQALIRAAPHAADNMSSTSGASSATEVANLNSCDEGAAPNIGSGVEILFGNEGLSMTPPSETSILRAVLGEVDVDDKEAQAPAVPVSGSEQRVGLQAVGLPGAASCWERTIVPSDCAYDGGASTADTGSSDDDDSGREAAARAEALHAPLTLGLFFVAYVMAVTIPSIWWVVASERVKSGGMSFAKVRVLML